jgi:hypothetical protein
MDKHIFNALLILEVIISFLGFCVFTFLFVYVSEQQRYLFFFVGLYLGVNILNVLKKELEWKQKNRVVKYSQRKIHQKSIIKLSY